MTLFNGTEILAFSFWGKKLRVFKKNGMVFKITKKEEERPVFVAPPLPAGTPARMATPARIVPATPSHAFDSAVSDYV